VRVVSNPPSFDDYSPVDGCAYYQLNSEDKQWNRKEASKAFAQQGEIRVIMPLDCILIAARFRFCMGEGE